MALLPSDTLRLVHVIRDSLGSENRVKFLELINKGLDENEVISQQKFNRIFNKDSRTNKYPEIPISVLRAIALNTKYSISWILTGVGDMSNQQNKTSPTGPAEDVKQSNKKGDPTSSNYNLREIRSDQKLIALRLDEMEKMLRALTNLIVNNEMAVAAVGDKGNSSSAVQDSLHQTQRKSKKSNSGR